MRSFHTLNAQKPPALCQSSGWQCPGSELCVEGHNVIIPLAQGSHANKDTPSGITFQGLEITSQKLGAKTRHHFWTMVKFELVVKLLTI